MTPDLSLPLPQAGDSLSAALASSAALLVSSGVDSARAEGRMLVSAACGLDSSQYDLAAITGRQLTKDDAARLRSLLLRRCERIPLQHLLGEAHFRYLTVQIGPGALVPRPETELLVDAVLEHIDRLRAVGVSAPTILDIGTGSGVIAASIASERPGTEVTAMDLSPEALSWAAKNTLGLGVRLIEGDVREARAEFEDVFDVVVSNPPYVPPAEAPTQPEARHDPALALYGGGEDGMELPRAVMGQAAVWLKPGGFFAMEHSESQGAAVQRHLDGLGFEQARTHQDYTGRERYSTAVLPSVPAQAGSEPKK